MREMCGADHSELIGLSMGKSSTTLPIAEFRDGKAFDRWLRVKSTTSPGIWLKIAKKTSGRASITKAEAIDVALCHGWIDGQIDKFDAQFWLMRFTPRRPRSKWSANNRARAIELTAKGSMHPGGLAQVEAAKADGRWEAAYASASAATIPDDLQAALNDNPKAAAFFATLTGANRYAVLYRITTVKKAETRTEKIALFVSMLARGETIY
jgi:uncharacterized protein YdeI (YjbR/CyaY-like superfamily)